MQSPSQVPLYDFNNFKACVKVTHLLGVSGSFCNSVQSSGYPLHWNAHENGSYCNYLLQLSKVFHWCRYPVLAACIILTRSDRIPPHKRRIGDDVRFIHGHLFHLAGCWWRPFRNGWRSNQEVKIWLVFNIMLSAACQDIVFYQC